ncbi:Protein GVQW1 [Plecturocebus cupreus]
MTLREMRFHHVGQAGSELLTSNDLPTSASQSAGITGSSSAIQARLQWCDNSPLQSPGLRPTAGTTGPGSINEAFFTLSFTGSLVPPNKHIEILQICTRNVMVERWYEWHQTTKMWGEKKQEKAYINVNEEMILKEIRARMEFQPTEKTPRAEAPQFYQQVKYYWIEFVDAFSAEPLIDYFSKGPQFTHLITKLTLEGS